MSNSRLPLALMAHTSSFIVGDNWTTVQIWRGDAGAETLMAVVRTRIAPTSRSVAGRDVSSVQGESSPQFSVMSVPSATQVQAGDTVWRGSSRFRVVSVDQIPHGLQVIMRDLQ